MNSSFLQPTLRDDRVALVPLTPDDFERLYAVACDPLIWEQHPQKTRYQRDVFQTFFDGAMASGGAFRVVDAKTDETIGSSRFYDFDEAGRSIAIGYTFVARRCWGGSFNRSMKTLMLDHAFTAVDRAVFHVGAYNVRSRTAMERLGGVLVGEMMVAYHGEKSSPNVVYEISREAWARRPGAPLAPHT